MVNLSPDTRVGQDAWGAGYRYTDTRNYRNLWDPDTRFMFNHAGAPWLTRKWVRRVMQAAKSDITPFGGYGGDEDQGMMGALNVLMAMGLFSLSGGCLPHPILELSSPIFDRITIHLDDAYYGGGRFVIETSGNSSGDRYIQSAELNGHALNVAWLDHRDLASGGLLTLVLGSEPNTSWGRDIARDGKRSGRAVTGC